MGICDYLQIYIYKRHYRFDFHPVNDYRVRLI